MLRTRWWGVMFILAVVLMACGGNSNTPPTLTPAVASTTTSTSTPIALAPTATATTIATPTAISTATPTSTPTAKSLNPLSIEYIRQLAYPGSEITLEQTLAPGSNFSRYVTSYQSEGFKISALLTVPNGKKPVNGWPVIIFNHGYIAPRQYSTTASYATYQDALARAGYITFKSDYRGNGNSEGAPTNPHLAPDYPIDVLNALASLKKFPDADPNRIGQWGHSLGGGVTLRAMIVSKDIKAGVIWSGTVGSYDLDMIAGGFRAPSSAGARSPLQSLIEQYGSPQQNPQFWASISPMMYIADLAAPLQLHHDLADSEVAFKYSQEVFDQAKQAGKPIELYSYPGDDHNLANSFGLAMQRSIAFFDQYLKEK